MNVIDQFHFIRKIHMQFYSSLRVLSQNLLMQYNSLMFQILLFLILGMIHGHKLFKSLPGKVNKRISNINFKIIPLPF